jgi:HK97 family phage portal protein
VGNLARRITAGTDPALSSTVNTASQWLLDIVGGGKTSSGAKVTPETAMRVTTVWRCVSLLSWLRAYLPLKVFRARTSPEGGADIDRKHSNYRLLAYQPNPWMTSFGWRQFGATSLLTYGNEYNLLDWQGGQLRQIVPIHPARVRVYVDREGFPVYRVTLFPTNETKWLSRFEMHHIWTVSSDGYVGLSPIEQSRETVGYALAAEEFGGRILANGAVPSGALELPASFTPEIEAAVKASWKDVHEGVVNTGRTAVLKGGVKYTPLGMKFVDIQWVEARQFTVEEICRIYGVPPELVQHTSKSTSFGTGVEQRFMSFLATTLDPILVADEQAKQRDLFLPEDMDVVYAQYNRGALLRTDLLSRYRSYAIGRQWGWLTVNKILAFEDMNPVGPEGDVLLDPLNMVRIPVDPTASLDAGGNGGGGAQASLDPRIAEFVRAALESGGSHA